MAAALTNIGVSLTEPEDGFAIAGNGGEPLRCGTNFQAKAHLDHRITVAKALTCLANRDGIEVDEIRPIATSFPVFERLLEEATQ